MLQLHTVGTKHRTAIDILRRAEGRDCVITLQALGEAFRIMTAKYAVPATEAAHAIVTFYLGVNLMTNLDPANEQTDEFFARARELAPLLGPLLAILPTASAGSPGRPSS